MNQELADAVTERLSARVTAARRRREQQAADRATRKRRRAYGLRQRHRAKLNRQGDKPLSPRRVKVDGDLFHPRIPDGAVYVGRHGPHLRRSPFFNPYTVKEHGVDEALRLFRAYLDEHLELVERARQELAGKDLACWCGLDEPCHADIWLDILTNEGRP